ncbi:MAG: ribonuclease R [FCB group bacterium]|nr:ribonuclease R [FCB group bacterium]
MQKKILEILSQNPGQSMTPREIQNQLGIKSRNTRQIKSELKGLAAANKIRILKGGKVRLVKKQTSVEGKLTMNQKGFGFVILDEDVPDVFIPRNFIRDAINGDRVRIQVFTKRHGMRTWGKIIEIVERKRSSFVGTLVKSGHNWTLEISPFTPERGIRVRKDKHQEWKAGQTVVAKVVDWGSAQTPLFCEITKIIGDSKDPRNDFELIVQSHDYSAQFPEPVTKALTSIGNRFIQKHASRRRNLRKLRVLTIDPASARDHDDGLSIRRNSSGYELGIHIADVSEFVPLHSDLDKEAFARATSVYLLDRVVPMLPDRLSGDLCSLMEGKDRLALSVLIQMDRQFAIQRWEVVESVVKTHAFLTYQDVQSILDGKEKSPYAQDCQWLWSLAKTWFRKRSEKGSIDFDIAEPVIELSETGIPHSITPSERLDSHRIVEECMLLANRLIAERFGGDADRGGALIYRVHEKPGEERLASFSRLLSNLNILPDQPDRFHDPAAIRDLLIKVEDSPYKNLIETLALRSMAKARYSTAKIGHFGLAFNTYCHFTSPIRRYPDLTVHRMIKAELNGKPSPYSVDELNQIASWTTEQEQKALIAEREFIRLKQLRWLNERIGEVFSGVISGVIGAGFFVELETSLAEGLVPAITLGDNVVFDEEKYQLQNRKTKETYALGDLVKVKVISVDLKKRRANFILA